MSDMSTAHNTATPSQTTQQGQQLQQGQQGQQYITRQHSNRQQGSEHNEHQGFGYLYNQWIVVYHDNTPLKNWSQGVGPSGSLVDMCIGSWVRLRY